MGSKLIETFADPRPVSSLNDHNLSRNNEVLEHLKKWQADSELHLELSKAEKGKRLLSEKLRFDMSSMIIGFYEVCNIAFMEFS